MELICWGHIKKAGAEDRGQRSLWVISAAWVKSAVWVVDLFAEPDLFTYKLKAGPHLKAVSI